METLEQSDRASAARKSPLSYELTLVLVWGVVTTLVLILRLPALAIALVNLVWVTVAAYTRHWKAAAIIGGVGFGIAGLIAVLTISIA
ncbi:hypothetical protein [Microbacterium sp. SLBN-146]|uniref:hypothetical protein n=1 Tax=Microbacterium sp. SLBN-146 TaxID=2768457 RepID=UPI00114F3DF0|nr:hypothetical protein [Microbacterium sp. SLBN-146]TQJ30832.1 hypothetical protein FBY39_1289 [Microbacterium sp. SLBN-146]